MPYTVERGVLAAILVVEVVGEGEEERGQGGDMGRKEKNGRGGDREHRHGEEKRGKTYVVRLPLSRSRPQVLRQLQLAVGTSQRRDLLLLLKLLKDDWLNLFVCETSLLFEAKDLKLPWLGWPFL